jgi:predicted esterase
MVASWIEKRDQLQAVAQMRFERTYLAGSSSGAYFVAALAARGDFVADGYGAMSGGAAPATNRLAELEPRPFYVGFGTHDTVGPAARGLAALLEKAGWPVKLAAHPLGHGAKEIYIDEAFAFWQTEAGALRKSP